MKYAVFVLWVETALSEKELMIWNALFPWKSRLLRVMFCKSYLAHDICNLPCPKHISFINIVF